MLRVEFWPTLTESRSGRLFLAQRQILRRLEVKEQRFDQILIYRHVTNIITCEFQRCLASLVFLGVVRKRRKTVDQLEKLCVSLCCCERFEARGELVALVEADLPP